MMETLIILGFLLILGLAIVFLFPLLLIYSLYQLMVGDPNVVQFPDKSEDS